MVLTVDNAAWRSDVGGDVGGWGGGWGGEDMIAGRGACCAAGSSTPLWVGVGVDVGEVGVGCGGRNMVRGIRDCCIYSHTHFPCTYTQYPYNVHIHITNTHFPCTYTQYTPPHVHPLEVHPPHPTHTHHIPCICDWLGHHQPLIHRRQGSHNNPQELLECRLPYTCIPCVFNVYIFRIFLVCMVYGCVVYGCVYDDISYLHHPTPSHIPHHHTSHTITHHTPSHISHHPTSHTIPHLTPSHITHPTSAPSPLTHIPVTCGSIE